MTTSRPRNAMMQGVQNPEIMYRSDPLQESMRARLQALGYALHTTELLVKGLPIVYVDTLQNVNGGPGTSNGVCLLSDLLPRWVVHVLPVMIDSHIPSHRAVPAVFLDRVPEHFTPAGGR